MLQVCINFYYLAVHKNTNIGYWHGVYLATNKQFKNRNPNSYFTRKSIERVARCKKGRIYFCTTFIEILIIESYFVYGNFLIVRYSNRFLSMSVQQKSHYLFIFLRKSNHPNISLAQETSYYYCYTVQCSKKLISWGTPYLLCNTNKFRTRQFTTPKCRTRYGKPEVSVINL